jgi:hypothetical protein
LETIACIGTAPSLTLEQIDIARRKGFRLFGCNNVYQIVPDLELLYGCNAPWWDEYWNQGAAEHRAEKWTTNRSAAERYGLNWIEEREGDGLCTVPNIIHHGHGGGFSLLSMAHKKGARRVVLLGYQLRYARDYDGPAKRIGSQPRHYFGEYPTQLQHWPSVHIRDGEHVELVRLYKTVADQGLVELVNCTPDSALEEVIGYTAIDTL